ncbi:MAG: PAS domain-containing protein [Parvibaculum sp.]
MLAEQPDVLQTAGTKQFFDYWNSLPKDGVAPDRSDFNPARIAPLMAAVSILEIFSDTVIMQRLAGTGLSRAMGFDPTGKNALDLMAPELRPDYIKLIKTQISVPCGRWNIIRSRRSDMIDRAEVLTLPMRYRVSGNWMILSYFAALKPIAYDPGPYQILGYEDTRWIDIGAGVPD